MYVLTCGASVSSRDRNGSDTVCITGWCGEVFLGGGCGLIRSPLWRSVRGVSVVEPSILSGVTFRVFPTIILAGLGFVKPVVILLPTSSCLIPVRGNWVRSCCFRLSSGGLCWRGMLYSRGEEERKSSTLFVLVSVGFLVGMVSEVDVFIPLCSE